MSAALAFVKMIVPFAPLAFGLRSPHQSSACWPTKNALNAAFRRVSSDHAWSASVIALAEDAGNPAVDVVHDKRRRPEVSNDVLEQQLHGRRFAGIARVSTHAVRLLQGLQDRFVRIPGGDADTHAALREQPGATRADAGAAANDECNVLHGWVRVGLSHVACSHVSRDATRRFIFRCRRLRQHARSRRGSPCGRVSGCSSRRPAPRPAKREPEQVDLLVAEGAEEGDRVGRHLADRAGIDPLDAPTPRLSNAITCRSAAIPSMTRGSQSSRTAVKWCRKTSGTPPRRPSSR